MKRETLAFAESEFLRGNSRVKLSVGGVLFGGGQALSIRRGPTLQFRIIPDTPTTYSQKHTWAPYPCQSPTEPAGI